MGLSAKCFSNKGSLSWKLWKFSIEPLFNYWYALNDRVSWFILRNTYTQHTYNLKEPSLHIAYHKYLRFYVINATLYKSISSHTYTSYFRYEYYAFITNVQTFYSMKITILWTSAKSLFNFSYHAHTFTHSVILYNLKISLFDFPLYWKLIYLATTIIQLYLGTEIIIHMRW